MEVTTLHIKGSALRALPVEYQVLSDGRIAGCCHNICVRLLENLIVSAHLLMHEGTNSRSRIAERLLRRAMADQVVPSPSRVVEPVFAEGLAA